MDRPTGSQPFGDLQRWLLEARAGSGASRERLLGLCREHLWAVAAEELPAGPGREEEARSLVEAALVRLPEFLPAFEGASEGDLRAWLRQVLLSQLPALSEQPRPEPAAPEKGDTTHGHGSASTPDQVEAPAGDSPTVTHRPAGDVSSPTGLSQAQTMPEAPGTTPEQAGGRTLPGLPPLDGFEHARLVGAGGMGIVYRAWQTRLKRWVALKCLPPAFATDPDRLHRFQQETLLAAQLTEPGVVQVYDVLEVGETPVLVLPYIDGCDLNQILGQRRQLRAGKAVRDPHPAALEGERAFVARMLPFFDRVLDALAGLHGAGVLHRDLKPANILVDKNGNGWLTDFGLARLHRPDAATPARQAMGTHGFMSPEQWEGDDNVDVRTDVFAMGVTLYEAFTLELPYGKARITAATPPAELPGARRGLLPANLDLVLRKAIHPDRERRYQSAADLRDDWQRVRKGLLPRKVPVSAGRRLAHVARRPTSLAVAVAAVAVAVAAVLAAVQPKPAPPATRTVRVTTMPPGARVALVPLDPDDGTPQFDKALQPAEKTPLTVLKVPPGDYLVVAEVAGHGFHEVYRRVPKPGEKSPGVASLQVLHTLGGPAPPQTGRDDRGRCDATVMPHRQFTEAGDTIEMPCIAVPKSDVTEGMAFFRGGEFTMGNAEYGPLYVPLHARAVAPFYLDKTEVTVAAYRAVRGSLPPGMEQLKPKDDEAVRLVTFDMAVRCAEQMGKRLPDEAEYEFAATNGGKDRFPWGGDFERIKSWEFGRVGSTSYDRALANPDVRGLYSNVAEWTSSWHAPYPGVERFPETTDLFRNQRIVRGGPFSVVQGDARPRDRDKAEFWDARARQGIDRDKPHPGLGFRCARSLKPRFPQPPAKPGS